MHIQQEDRTLAGRTQDIDTTAIFRPVNISTNNGNPGKKTREDAGGNAIDLGEHGISGSIANVRRRILDSATNGYDEALVQATGFLTARFTPVHNAHQLRDNWGGLGDQTNVTHWPSEFEQSPWNSSVELSLDTFRQEVASKNVDKPEHGAPIAKPWDKRARMKVRYKVWHMPEAAIDTALNNEASLTLEDRTSLRNILSYIPKKSKFTFYSTDDAASNFEEYWSKEYTHTVLKN